jgi:hypothetical protein
MDHTDLELSLRCEVTAAEVPPTTYQSSACPETLHYSMHVSRAPEEMQLAASSCSNFNVLYGRNECHNAVMPLPSARSVELQLLLGC